MLGSELMSYAAGAGAWGRLNGVVLPIFETSIADDVTGDVTPSAAFPAAACAAFSPPNAELSTTAGVLRAGSVIKLSVDAQVSPGTNKRCNCGARFGVDVCTTARYTVRCRLSMTIQNIQPRDTVAVTAAEHVFSVQAMKADQARNDICFDGLSAVLLAIALAGDEWSVSIRAPNGHLYNFDQLGALLSAYA